MSDVRQRARRVKFGGPGAPGSSCASLHRVPTSAAGGNSGGASPAGGLLPARLRCLFARSRYKFIYGGRGAAKSWSVARALLLPGKAKPLRILCAREFQNSLAESVHRLLAEQIEELHLSGFYSVQKAVITGGNGTSFVFAGLRHKVSKIKSFEGVDIVWVEEGQTVSKHSFDVLIPTIRRPGSEIWVTFNPDLEEDDAWRRFVAWPIPGSIVQSMKLAR